MNKDDLSMSLILVIIRSHLTESEICLTVHSVNVEGKPNNDKNVDFEPGDAWVSQVKYLVF